MLVLLVIPFLARCKALRVIGIRLPYLVHAFSRVSGFIRALQAKGIELFILSLLQYRGTDFPKLDESLDKVLEERKLPKLRTIAVGKLCAQADPHHLPPWGDACVIMKYSEHRWMDELSSFLPRILERRYLCSVTRDGELIPIPSGGVSLSTWDMVSSAEVRYLPL